MPTQKLSPHDVQQKLAGDCKAACFIDVRTQEEFSSGHVPGAACIPLDQIESGSARIPRDKLVILSCLGGKRSARAHEILLSRGFANVVEMEGGYNAWCAQGLPVVKTG